MSLHLRPLFIAILFVSACHPKNDPQGTIIQGDKIPFTWKNASIYFLLTDRFNNGNQENDQAHDMTKDPAALRGYMGGDIAGITAKIRDGYFQALGVQAIWLTPVVEQIRGSVDEGTGISYGYHGYWTRDWTALDPSFGTVEELKELVDVAHRQNIRILMDVVANHTGPVTEKDPVWPSSWVKTEPPCSYEDYASTVNCTLVENLPDVRTESAEEVALPPFLVEKWKSEGRYDKEIEELDQWFMSTGYSRTPVNYILKWLVDFIKEYGIDGFRVDTVKHTESYVWKNLYKAAAEAWQDYKTNHPDAVIDPETPFYMVGEVYNYYASNGRIFDYGDVQVDFYTDGFDALINFDFKTDAQQAPERIFSKYDSLLQGPLSGKSLVHYISSHDDGSPFDKNRTDPMDAGTKLLLCPGGVQIYYGDETARTLNANAAGDAALRSFMNWEELENDQLKGDFTTKEILHHWQKLGKFRAAHPAVGAGRHQMISDAPYVFSRTLENQNFPDQVVVAVAEDPINSVTVGDIFPEGTNVLEAYSGQKAVVEDGKVTVDIPSTIFLLSRE